MRYLFSLFLLSLSALGADYVVNGALMAHFTAVPADRVNNLRTFVTNGVDRADLINPTTEMRFETNNGIIEANIEILFQTGSTYSNKLWQKWDSIEKYNWPAGITGVVSMHFCALDPANTNAYIPCDSPAAYFKKVTIP